MVEDKLIWCLKQKKGISIVTPNDNLSSAYIKEADDTLDSMLNIKGKWKYFVNKCKEILDSINIKFIDNIRAQIKND